MLAQNQAPDGSGWTVTTWIAAAAAVISLATLIVTTISTAKREDRKWAREALSQAFYELIDASYQHSDTMGDVQRGLWDPAYEPRLDTSRQTLQRAELTHRQANTKIRLLAPRATVEIANDLRMKPLTTREKINPTLTPEEFRQLASAITMARVRLIDSAKKTMSVPR